MHISVATRGHIKDQNGDILQPEHSTLDFDRIKGTDKTMYLNQGHAFDGLMGVKLFLAYNMLL